jgi:hypothetical protein
MSQAGFRFFDPTRSAGIHRRRLPHWEQKGTCAFVTFRLLDSLPPTVVQAWNRKRRDWLVRKGLPEGLSMAEALENLGERDRRSFQRFASSRYEAAMDKGLGTCVLRDPQVRGLLVDSLVFGDGTDYLLGGYVIMPNHVHLLIQPMTRPLSEILSTVRTCSARVINRHLGRRGQLWDSEPFDHLVRSPHHFLRYQQYIAMNPRRARLPPSDYTLWQRVASPS